MIAFIRSVYKLLQMKLIAVLILMIIGGVFEGVSLLLLVPILQTAIGLEADSSNYIIALTDFASWIGVAFTLKFGLFLFFCLFLVQTLIFFVREKNVASIISFTRQKIRCDLYSSLLQSKWTYLVGKKRGWLVSAVVNDAEKAGNSIYSLLLLLTSIVVSLVYTATAFAIAPLFTIVMIMCAGLMFAVLKRLMSRGTRFGKTTSEGNSQLQAFLNEHFDAMRLIKGSALYDMSITLIGRATKVLSDVERNVLVHNAKIKVYTEPVIMSLLCIGIFLAVEQMNVGIAEIMVVLLVFMLLFPRVIQMNQTYYQVLVYKPAYERVMQLTEHAGKLREHAFTGGAKFEGLRNGIELRNVSFSFTQEQKVMKGINFTINKGETIAIVGSSGAGKSTLTDLILGLVEPDDGAIYVDGRPLKEYDLISYRKRIGYVTQETILIHDTIKQNIVWGIDHPLTDQKVESIARLCHVHEFVSKLPEQYNTIVGDKGMMISGGQRQRLAIARALAKEPELLILDEATSALDSESEKIVQQAIEDLSEKITILIIAHRLSTIVNADKIIVLEKGSIVESGSFDKLINMNGRFKNMYELQYNS